MKRSHLLGAAAAAVLVGGIGMVALRHGGGQTSPRPSSSPSTVQVVQAPPVMRTPRARPVPIASAVADPRTTPVAEPRTTTVAEVAATPGPPSPDMVARLRGLFKVFPRQQQLFDALVKEPRDAQWVTRSEAMLNSLYAAMPHAGDKGEVVDIYCGSTNCMATGNLPAQNEHGEVQAAMSAMQSIDLVKSLMAQGYTPNGSAFGPSATENRPMFVTFYRRSTPVIIKTR